MAPCSLFAFVTIIFGERLGVLLLLVTTPSTAYTPRHHTHTPPSVATISYVGRCPGGGDGAACSVSTQSVAACRMCQSTYVHNELWGVTLDEAKYAHENFPQARGAIEHTML